MVKSKKPAVDAGELRRRAEERLQAEEFKARLASPELESARLLHELQVHQIELEMQNAELSQARDELEKSLERYSDLYDFAPVGYLTLDRDGVIVAANLTGAGLLGVERSRLLGRQLVQLVAAPDRSRYAGFLVAVFSGCGKEVCEVALQNRGEAPLLVQIEASSELSGECHVALIDITRRRRSEDALREIQERESRSLETQLLLSEERFSLFMENLPGVAFIKDTKGRYIFCNKGCQVAFARNGVQEILNRTDAELWPAEIAAGYQENDRQVLDKRSALQFVQPYFRRGNNKKLWMIVSKFPILDQNGEPELLCGIGIDISEKKEAEDALREHQEQLFALTAELSLAEERERRRIAGELHDQIGQTLAFAKIKLDVLHHTLESTGHARAVAEIRTAIETSIQEVRTLTFQISPPLLYELGFDAALDWLCEWALDTHGLEVQFQDEWEPEELTEKVRSTLFQSVRELLINIAKLVVDDEPQNIMLLEGFLVREGYGIIPAQSGAEALGKLFGTEVDLVLLDIKMPDMSGFEVLTRLRSDKKTQRIPVIMITSHTENEARLKSLELGCDDFISKPFKQYELLARVKSLLRIKLLNDEVDEAREFAESVINTVREPLICLDQDLRVLTINRSFCDFFQVKPEETVGELIYDLGNKQWDIPKLRELLETILPQRTTLDNYEVEHDFITIGRRTMLLNARQMQRSRGKEGVILLAIEDITAGKLLESEKKAVEDSLRENQEKLSALTAEISLNEERERRHIAGELHDQIGQTLAFAKIKLDVLQQDLESSGHAGDLREIQRAIEASIQEVRSLTFQISPPLLYEIGFEAALDWLCEWELENHRLEVQFQDDRQAKPLSEAIRSTLFQAVRELLVNTVKHAQTKKAAISFKKSGSNLILQVSDQGIGFDVKNVAARKESSMGFGLFNIKQRIGHLGGQFSITSEPGKGTLVTLVVPCQGETGQAGIQQNSRESA
jgi:PAS domain S-box-containing protein